ncbi:MAG: FAD-binding oxidoreductase, partial [Cyanobacteria bacterium J06638_6]
MADIERIQNPLSRSAVSALTGAAAATMVTAGVLGLTAIEDRSIYRLSLYASLAGAVAGAVLGGVVLNPTPEPAAKTTANQAGEWTDWRNFVVVKKVAESREITSFYLKPQDGNSLPGFMPGQFLTIKLNVPGQPRPVIRTYSLSDYADQPDYYRLSIKREGPPRGQEVPPGVA